MTHRNVISAYTPSNTDPKILERIFVQRERLLSKIVDRLARSMTTGDKHHILLVGPRGSGKTHLVSLAEYGLRNRAELTDLMRIAWLGEDDTFTGLIDIALGIADQLAEEYPDEFAADYRTSVRALPADDAAESILNSIVDRLGNRSLVLIMENMDRVFSGLGDLGQKKWRAFLQEKPRIATLATSQQLFDGITSRDETFFGFFDIHHLKPLTVGDARDLIKKISLEQGNHELVAFLDSAEGRYRVRAVHHLAGGNHRMYVLLAEFLTKESLDDLVDAFEGLAEDLTPYFQERVRSLAPQQAKIVQCLCNASGAMTVKQIAEDTFIAERNCSKQLGNLKEKGYVQSQKRGKDSFYEIAEPLMRLCVEVKHQRGRPLKLVAKFLRAWFPESKLSEGLAQHAISPSSRSDQYRASAVDADNAFEKVIQGELKKEIQQQLNKGQYDEALELASELQCVDPLSANVLNFNVAYHRQDYTGCVEALSSIINDSSAPGVRATALFNRGVVYSQQDDIEHAFADFTAVIEIADAPPEQKAKALFNRGSIHSQQSDFEQALADYTAVIEMIDAPVELKVKALFYRGFSHEQRDDTELAQADLSAVIDIANAPAKLRANALIGRGLISGVHGDITRELVEYTSVIEMTDARPEQKAVALFFRGEAHEQQGNIELALADYTAVIEMVDAPPDRKAKALFRRGVVLCRSESYQAAQEGFEAALSVPEVPAQLRSEALFALPEPMIANTGRDEVIAALESAFKEGDADSEAYGGTPHGLLAMILRRGHQEWQGYIAELIPIYDKYGAAAKLGQGVTLAIELLDAGGYSETQLDVWNDAWQTAGEGCEELELPLRSLDAAIETIKTKSDRPLFRLPLEIRELVRPLLVNSFAQ